MNQTILSTRPGFHLAKVLSKQLVSSQVCVFQLHVPTLETFLPGQWVDFVLHSGSKQPPWVGGFSFVSTPSDLPLCTFAVKRSSQAPTIWIHDVMQLNDTVQVRSGGTCVWEPNNEINCPRPVALVAGGIGISPMLSIYRSILEQNTNESFQKKPRPVSLLYSVSTEDELVFRREICDLHRRNGKGMSSKVIFALTKQLAWREKVDQLAVRYETGRQLSSFLNDINSESDYYICGPPAMVDDAVQILHKKGVVNEFIHFEKWW